MEELIDFIFCLTGSTPCVYMEECNEHKSCEDCVRKHVEMHDDKIRKETIDKCFRAIRNCCVYVGYSELTPEGRVYYCDNGLNDAYICDTMNCPYIKQALEEDEE